MSDAVVIVGERVSLTWVVLTPLLALLAVAVCAARGFEKSCQRAGTVGGGSEEGTSDEERDMHVQPPGILLLTADLERLEAGETSEAGQPLLRELEGAAPAISIWSVSDEDTENDEGGELGLAAAKVQVRRTPCFTYHRWMAAAERRAHILPG
jgi:hypothetical protein